MPSVPSLDAERQAQRPSTAVVASQVIWHTAASLHRNPINCSRFQFTRLTPKAGQSGAGWRLNRSSQLFVGKVRCGRTAQRRKRNRQGSHAAHLLSFGCLKTQLLASPNLDRHTSFPCLIAYACHLAPVPACTASQLARPRSFPLSCEHFTDGQPVKPLFFHPPHPDFCGSLEARYLPHQKC